METVRCPHCGSPVTLYENSWECGWCGDFGNIASLGLSEQADPPACSMDHIAFDVLERGVFSILQGIRSRFGNGDTENRLTFELAIYGICQGLLPLRNRTQRNQQLLQAFFQEYPVCTVREVMDSVRQQKLPFEEQFSLSKQYIGSFWKSLISEISDDVSCDACPDWINQIIEGLSQVESVFSGADHSKLYETFLEAFHTHWNP